MHDGIRITIPVSFDLWQRLRDRVEVERKNGRTSLSRVVVQILEREMGQRRAEEVQR